MRLLLLSLFSPIVFALPCPQWSPAQASAKLAELSQEIRSHDNLYFNHHKTVISDADYDLLRQHLTALHECFPSLLESDAFPSTTKNLNSMHQAGMISLNKAYDERSIIDFLQKAATEPLLLQPKIDGIAIELVYKKGLLIAALTRGDGQKGKNIFPQMQHVSAIPKQLHQKENIILHGELFARLDKLKNKHHGYTSARHFVAAHIHRQETDSDAMDQLDFFPWEWIDSPYQTERQNISALAEKGFSWPSLYTYTIDSLESIQSLRQTFYKPSEPVPFLMDGIVIKLNNLNTRKQWGANQVAPRWALAWKFPAISAVTIIKNITFTIGRTGAITPILTIEARRLGGLTIASVSLGSVAILKDNSLSVGDHIMIELKGQATPVFKRVLIQHPKSTPITIPDQKLYNNVSCLSWSISCHQQFLARLRWLTNSNGLNLPFLTTTHLNKLVHSGQITALDQLLSLPNESLINLGFSPTKVARFNQVITGLATLPFEQRLIAISPPGISKHKARLIAKHYKDFQQLKKTSAHELGLYTNSSDAFSLKLLDFLERPEISSLIKSLSTNEY
ncbi:MAG: hypothetical protein PUP46_03830 [Endozoicomonas sp. (ex Botrylloides leachii)]|nr:hypothetical protein [Endozoicomonas sp. (ex Botrylloides leachii)]